MFSSLLTAILPVFAVAAVGGILRKVSGSDLRGLHVLAYYFAGPALVFTTIFQADLASEWLWKTGLFALFTYAGLMLVGMLWARLAGWDGDRSRGAVLALASKNCANYGLPILAFAFGERGVVIGTVFVVAHIVVHVALGGTYASWRESLRIGPQARRILSIPYLWAAALAIILRRFVADLPVPLEESLLLLGRTWIPLLILLLGAEVSTLSSFRQVREAVPLTLVKLILPPLIAYAATLVLGIRGTEQAILILQGSMPTAVNGLIFARQFQTRPDLVATTLVLSTLGSIAAIPLLLSLLT